MYKIKTTCNIYESIGFDYPGEEAIKLMSNEEKKAVYLEGISKMNYAINMLAGLPMESNRTFLMWTLQAFKNNFMNFLIELGMTREEIDAKLNEDKEKNKEKKI